MPLISAYAVRGAFAAPAVRYASVDAGFRGPRGPRTSTDQATDGGSGSGYADRFHPDSRPDLAFQLVAGIPEFSHRVAAAWRRS
jgi:hypothetical protein